MPLRGRVSDVFTGFQRFSEVIRGFERFFRGPLRDPLRGRFPSQRLSVLLPLFLLPLNLSPKIALTTCLKNLNVQGASLNKVFLIVGEP